MKTSRKVFEDEMKKSNATEDEVNSLIRLFDGGTASIKAYCDYMAPTMYWNLSKKTKVFAKRVVAGEKLNQDEQDEYIQAVIKTQPKSISNMVKCIE